MRDRQWAFMQQVAATGTLWCCWWNKDRHHVEPYPADLVVCGLIDGIELMNWIRSHEDWWQIGEWSDERYASPVSLTDAGRTALEERDRYDMEPVFGGLVEPGWQAIPWPKEGSDELHA
jgi:hypothetical protein